MNSSVSGNNRIVQVDMAKAIGIILVIALHTFGGMVLKFSLSFVMPMFFILSGMTCKYSSSADEFINKSKKLAVRLLIIPIVVYIPKAVLRHQSIPSLLLTYIFQRCETVSLSTVKIEAVGLLWFFSALFCARVIFDFIKLKFSNKSLPFISVILTLTGVIMGHYKIWLPLNFDIGLAMQFFMYFAYISPDYIQKKTTTIPKMAVATFLVSLLYCISFGLTCIFTKDYLNIPRGIYPLFPLCILTAIAGSVGLLFWCSLAKEIPIIRKPLSFIGSSSVFAYCIHCLDNLYSSLWTVHDSLLLTFILRLACDMAITILSVVIFKYIHYLISNNKTA